ncbi:GL1D1-like protein [Mya arenaria]|uniref:GL1D1-like protein n=1 Tax=Mya arenaria TaxID=6604 RepID=A0ABY7DZD7_MYAAR|nr:GL1D1-like protein [Mya arenaria]
METGNQKNELLYGLNRDLGLDEPYFQRFYAALSRCPGVVYVGGLDHEDAQAAVSVSKALVNSSVSEGMALSLLEAMALGTPVLARKIPGNAAIVEDGTTGFLFDTAEEFSSKLETIFVDAEARKSVTSRARAYVTEKHSLEAEQAAYVSVASIRPLSLAPLAAFTMTVVGMLSSMHITRPFILSVAISRARMAREPSVNTEDSRTFDVVDAATK